MSESMDNHPFVIWWRTKTGWSDGHDLPMSSEGKLAKDAWNSAIDAATDCIVKDGNPIIALQKIRKLSF